MAKGRRDRLTRSTRLKHHRQDGEVRKGARKGGVAGSKRVGRFQGGKGIRGYG